MWIQATLSRDDFARVLSSMLPLRIQLAPGSADSGLIYLGKARHVSLVPGRGLRIRVRGQIRWPVLGVAVPVTLKEVQIVLEPHIMGRGRNQRLAFVPVVEQADVAVVPGFVERWLIPKLNKQLASPDSEFAWKFLNTLNFEFPLPAQLDPTHKMGLRATWGAVKVTREAMTLAVSLETKITRGKVRPLTAKEVEPEAQAPVPPGPAPDPREGAFLAPEPALAPVSNSRPATIDERSLEPNPPPEFLPPEAPDPRAGAPIPAPTESGPALVEEPSPQPRTDAA